jgi:hypothetical protein
MNQMTDTASSALLAEEAGFDPIEERLRANVRATIEAVFEEELASFLGRLRYVRGDGPAKGYRHGHRERQLTGTFGTETVRVPRARIEDDTGKVTEWRSKALPRYKRLTEKAEALIAAVYLSGTNTRRVKRALFGLFEGAVEPRTWSAGPGQQGEGGPGRSGRARSLVNEDIVRFARSLGRIAVAGSLLDGTVIRTRLDRKATNISVLAAIGVRRDGQKVLLSIRNMGGESTSAWRRSGGLRGRICGRGPPSPRRSGRTRPEAPRLRDRRRRAGAGGRGPLRCGARTCRSSAAPCIVRARLPLMRRSE